MRHRRFRPVMPGSRFLVVSPHYDDAVFGCGAAIASRTGTIVATVFAGRPKLPIPYTEWDRASGFALGDDVVGARREEDRAALRRLRATPAWMDFLDSQYGASYEVETVARTLNALLERVRPRYVLVPLGLFHSDHVLAHYAARFVMRLHPEVRWFAYEDALYRRIPGLVDERIAELRANGYAPRRVRLRLSNDARAGKRDAVKCYRSQIRALATPGCLGHADAYAPERFWVLGSSHGC